MQLTNQTPYSPFLFESLNLEDRSIHCIFCRGTFDLVGGRELVLAAEQEPVVLADCYRKDPLTSSVAVDTDLVPQKLAADITLNAMAYAPHGEPRESWQASVSVGRVGKSLQIFGPRQWQHSTAQSWRLSKPNPTSQVPIHYEFAFGGSQMVNDIEHICEENPVGLGYVVEKPTRRDAIIPAAQVEDPADPIREFGRKYAPAGFGPIAKHCLPRRTLCGTADEVWKKERWPLRPKDFDFRYYNSAPAGLVYPGFLDGREAVRIVGCSPHGEINFRLPGVDVTLFAIEQGLQIAVEAMKLDTLHIDLVKSKVSLTWRSTLLKQSPLRSVQILPGRLDQSHQRVV